MAGLFGVLRIHDVPDLAHHVPACYDVLSHRTELLHSARWNLSCHQVKFRHPWRFTIESETAENPGFRFLERTWMVCQLPIALVLCAVGGWNWGDWGVSVCIVFSVARPRIVTCVIQNLGIGYWNVGATGYRR